MNRCSRRRCEQDTDLPYGLVAITFRFPGSDSPDYAAAQILSDVFSSQRGKLYGLVPEGKALFASFEYDDLPKAGLGYAVAEFPAGGDSTDLLEQVRDILAAEVTNGVMADLVEAAKRREIASAELQKNSVSGLASAWSQAVAIEGRQSPDDDVTPSGRSPSPTSIAWRSNIWILTTPSSPFSRRNPPANPFPQRALAARNRSLPRKPRVSNCPDGREK